MYYEKRNLNNTNEHCILKKNIYNKTAHAATWEPLVWNLHYSYIFEIHIMIKQSQEKVYSCMDECYLIIMTI